MWDREESKGLGVMGCRRGDLLVIVGLVGFMGVGVTGALGCREGCLRSGGLCSGQ